MCPAVGRARTAQELASAVDSLFRVTASESAPGADGQKTVWHQGTGQAELFSHVDAAGRVVRQEFMLFDDFLRWEPRVGVSTGARADARRVGHASPNHDYTLDSDDTVRLDRLTRVQQALANFRGDDRYITHWRAVVAATIEGETSDVGAPVTGAADARQLRDALARSNRSPWRRWALVAGVAVALGLGLLLANLLGSHAP